VGVYAWYIPRKGYKMKNTFAYLLDNDNVVTGQQVEEYFKRFFADFVTIEGAEFVELQDNERSDEFHLFYTVLMCGDCEDAELEICECVPQYESIGYKSIEVFGNL
jgi:hypothetical protein